MFAEKIKLDCFDIFLFLWRNGKMQVSFSGTFEQYEVAMAKCEAQMSRIRERLDKVSTGVFQYFIQHCYVWMTSDSLVRGLHCNCTHSQTH